MGNGRESEIGRQHDVARSATRGVRAAISVARCTFLMHAHPCFLRLTCSLKKAVAKRLAARTLRQSLCTVDRTSTL